MAIPKPPYVRAFLLCGRFDQRPSSLDLVAVHTGPNRFVRGSKVSGRVGVFLLIERDGDRASHLLEVRWQHPNGAFFWDSGTIPLAESDTVIHMNEVPISMESWVEGRYRLVLFIDGSPAAYCPFDIVATEPGSLH